MPWEYRVVAKRGYGGSYADFGIYDCCVREDGTVPNWSGEPVELKAHDEEALRERIAKLTEALEKPVLVWSQSLSEEEA
jgi:hypothetical protein